MTTAYQAILSRKGISNTGSNHTVDQSIVRIVDIRHAAITTRTFVGLRAATSSPATTASAVTRSVKKTFGTSSMGKAQVRQARLVHQARPPRIGTLRLFTVRIAAKSPTRRMAIMNRTPLVKAAMWCAATSVWPTT